MRLWAVAVLGGAALATGGLVAALASTIPPLIAVHAAGMLVAWGAMIPAGNLLARYVKVTPRQDFPAVVDNPFWWNGHRLLQYGGLALSTLGLAAIWSVTGGAFDTWHGRCGLAVMAVGWLQVVAAALRGSKGGPTDRRADPQNPATWRGDHYDMSRRRRLFDAWHKRAGWAVVALAGVTILLGIDLVGAPSWLLALAGLLQGATLCGLVEGAARGRWVDTYAALWGPDAAPPGERRIDAPPSARRPPRSPS